MNTLIIVIFAGVLYAVVVYWLLVQLKFKALWQSGDSTAVSNARLTTTVKHVLDFFLILCLCLIIMWLPFMVVMTISQIDNPSWGFDIVAYSGFKIDVSALAGVEFTGLRIPEISGKTSVSLDTSNLFAFYLFASSQLLSAIMVLYGVIQLRAIILSLRSGLSFTLENSQRIKKIGYVILLWNLVNPLFQYYAWGSVIKEVSFSTKGIQLYPAFEANAGGILLAMLLIILSGILREAAELNKEHELTI